VHTRRREDGHLRAPGAAKRTMAELTGWLQAPGDRFGQTNRCPENRNIPLEPFTCFDTGRDEPER
jgi:hypothetical protein